MEDDKNYVQKVIAKWELTNTAMKWRVCRRFGKKPNKQGKKETFGFPTTAPAPIPKSDCPAAKPLKEFQHGMIDLIRDIEFNKQTNKHQDKLRKDIAKIKSEKRVFVPADKTSNMYLVHPDRYKELLEKNVHKEYKKSSENSAILSEKADLKVAEKLEINDRVHRTAKRDSFVTLKDHKPGFRSNPQCRLLNPCKQELGKVSKQMLEKLNSKIRTKSQLKQWRRTKETRDWFNSLERKHTLTFLKFDVEAFYPSISEELLLEAFEWASTLVEITEEEKKVVRSTKKALLYVQGQPWTKKGDREFDVSMGSFDGAEVCEMVGLFILSLLEPTGVDLGLYRDDLLGVTSLKGRPLEMMKQRITSIFQEKGLKVVGTVNLEATDFLDVFLDLRAETHRPFAKEGDRPSYVHCQSNHPPSVLMNIGLGINKRLSMLSSNKELFDQAAPTYQDALSRSKHDHQLEFKEEEEPTVGRQSKTKRSRKREIIWWNPPFSINVKTNIGGKFLALIDKCFPKEGPMGKIFNRSNLKMSYSTCPNMKQVINAHNKKILAENLPEEEVRHCSCPKATREAGTCPLQGFCLDKNLVYQAKVVETRTDGVKQEETYVGCCGTEWKDRLGNHNKSFKHERYKRETVLSSHIWALKARGSTYTITWRILDRGAPFNHVTKTCMLCCKERFFIIRRPDLASLNSRQEVGNHCLHIASSLLSTVEKVKV